MTSFLRTHFPGANCPDITVAETGRVTLILPCGDAEKRPGGFISGPTLMSLADTAGLMGVFSHTGITAAAFTTSLSIEFLRPAQGDRIIAEGHVAKFGRTLSIINVTMRTDQNDKPCAQAVVTYATAKRSD